MFIKMGSISNLYNPSFYKLDLSITNVDPVRGHKLCMWSSSLLRFRQLQDLVIISFYLKYSHRQFGSNSDAALSNFCFYCVTANQQFAILFTFPPIFKRSRGGSHEYHSEDASFAAILGFATLVLLRWRSFPWMQLCQRGTFRGHIPDSPGNTPDFFGNMPDFCSNTRFCGNTPVFCGNTPVFCGNGRFRGNTPEACGNSRFRDNFPDLSRH
jgi:hypothetical protein